MRSVANRIGIFILLVFVAGCGQPTVAKAKPDDMAKAKLAAVNKLADLFAKNPNAPEAFEYLEDFRNSQYDPKDQPEVGAQIVEVYKTRIAGKYKSEWATQLGIEVKLFENALGKK